MQSVVSVIDDDQDMRDALLELLCSSGVRAAAFPGVEPFLASAVLESTSCIICDVQMDGMNGFDLIRTLSARQETIPVILISAYDTPATRQTAMRLGAFCLLAKPFDPQDILDQLRLALRTG